MEQSQTLPYGGYGVVAIGVLGSRIRIRVMARLNPASEMNVVLYDAWLYDAIGLSPRHRQQVDGQTALRVDPDEEPFVDGCLAEDTQQLVDVIKRLTWQTYERQVPPPSVDEVEQELDFSLQMLEAATEPYELQKHAAYN